MGKKTWGMIVLLLCVATAGVIIYLFMSNALTIDPDYAILGLCINVAIAFTTALSLMVYQCPPVNACTSNEVKNIN